MEAANNGGLAIMEGEEYSLTGNPSGGLGLMSVLLCHCELLADSDVFSIVTCVRKMFCLCDSCTCVTCSFSYMCLAEITFVLCFVYCLAICICDHGKPSSIIV